MGQLTARTKTGDIKVRGLAADNHRDLQQLDEEPCLSRYLYANSAPAEVSIFN